MSALRTVLQQGQKLTGLVEKLLNYTVLEDLQATELSKIDFKVQEVLDQSVEALKNVLAEKKAETSVACSPDIRAVGDPGLIRDVFKNLIENAVKFCANESPKVEIEALEEDGIVVIHFRDNGPGIPPEEIDRVFRKFYQIDVSFTGQIEGWGLGLPFAAVVLEKLGGGLRCESRVGEGCDFIVTLPAFLR